MTQHPSSGLFSDDAIHDAALAAYREGRAAAAQQAYDKAIQYYTDALSFDETPALFRARVYEYRGQCYWLLADFINAEQDYQASLDISDEKDQIARARVRLGELYDFRGKYEQAKKVYAQALEEGLAAGNLLIVGRAQRGLGIINRRQGHTEQAISHLIQALAAFREHGDAREQARVLTSLGRTRHARGEYQHALTAHREALTIFESLNDRWRVVQTLNDLGECYQALYDSLTAQEYHEKALQLAEQYGATLLKPEIQRNLGVDLVEHGRYEEGIAYLEQALAGAQALNNREQEALTRYNLARSYLRLEQLESARHSVTALQEIAEELNADRYRALAAFVRGELYFREGHQAKALSELNAAMLAAQTSVDRGVLWKLHATMSHVIENEAIANVHRTIAAEFIRQTAEPLQDAHLKQCFVQAAPVTAVLLAAGIDPNKL